MGPRSRYLMVAGHDQFWRDRGELVSDVGEVAWLGWHSDRLVDDVPEVVQGRAMGSRGGALAARRKPLGSPVTLQNSSSIRPFSARLALPYRAWIWRRYSHLDARPKWRPLGYFLKWLDDTSLGYILDGSIRALDNQGPNI